MKTLILGVLLGLAGLGCAREEATRPTVTTTSGRISISNESAIQDITNARCNRERACNNVGEERRYQAFEACLREIGHDTRSRLSTAECPRGISDADLSSCLTDIRAESCDRPLETIERVATCRKSKVCR